MKLLTKKGIKARYLERAFLTMLLSSLRVNSKFDSGDILKTYYKYAFNKLPDEKEIELTKDNINKIRAGLLQRNGKKKPILKNSLQIQRIKNYAFK